MNKTPLTDSEAQQIGGALYKLQEIGSTKIITPQNEAEQRGNIEFLHRILLEHANELLASWYAVHNEYEPLVHSFAALLNRSTHVIQARIAQQQAAAKAAQTPQADEVVANNIIPLTREN